MACTPEEVLQDAKCWLPLSNLDLQAALVQQLCVAAGSGCDPNDLMESAKCWIPLSSIEKWASFVWLLCQWNGDAECDPEAIIEDAKCWIQQSSQARMAALVQAFCDDNGGCVIQDVLDDSECLRPLSLGQLEAIMVWLMCQIAGETECNPEDAVLAAKCWLPMDIAHLQSAAVVLACSGELVHGDFNNDFSNDFFIQ